MRKDDEGQPVLYVTLCPASRHRGEVHDLWRAGHARDEGPTDELNCFVCSKPAGCGDCGFESDCNRSMVSQACICSGCMADASAYSNYQQAFIAKMHRVAKVKI